jgi:hypothetical protein
MLKCNTFRSLEGVLGLLSQAPDAGFQVAQQGSKDDLTAVVFDLSDAASVRPCQFATTTKLFS